MKKFITLFVALGIIALWFIGSALPAKAAAVKNEENLIIGPTQNIQSPVFANTTTLNVEGTIDGDLYCIGTNVVITGRINGDVFCLTQSFNLSGEVKGSVRLTSSDDTNISGTIDGDYYGTSQNFILTSKGKISRDLFLLATNVRLNGSIGRDAKLNAQSVDVGGYVGRDLSGDIVNATLSNDSTIKGNVNVTSKNDVIKMSGAKVDGNISRNTPSEARSSSIATLLFGYFVFVASLLLVSMLTVWAFPKFYDNTDKIINESLGKTSLYGLANLFIVPLLCVVLLTTLVGIPLSVLILVAWILSLILCGPVFAYYVGSKLVKSTSKKDSHYIRMLSGSVLVLLLYAVPLVNLIVGILVSVIGSGAILRYFKITNSKSNKN